ncbi:MAG TPA: radical SAM protein, partial [Planctomycetia bacterium]|nr:radical SAM protein [Planctomycetia bacterium]
MSTQPALRGEKLRDVVFRTILPKVQTPGQYIGGERNSIAKDHASVRATVCLAFPDAYALGMSHYGGQILYSILNDDPRWACERAYCPMPDFEKEIRAAGLPLYSLETFTPLVEFDVVGFSLQYEVCYTNLLNILDLGGIPLREKERGDGHPLIIAGGPGAQNPEVLAPFVDVFLIGDGEDSLPLLVERWADLKDRTDLSRDDKLAALVREFPSAYAPRFYEPDYGPDGSVVSFNRLRADVPQEILAAAIRVDFDDLPIPTRPLVPLIEISMDRIAIEIMRGCPWQCRFCQSTVIKRPLRVRSVGAIVEAAKEAYRNTGLDEISVMSLSSSDYPHFAELVAALA